MIDVSLCDVAIQSLLLFFNWKDVTIAFRRHKRVVNVTSSVQLILNLLVTICNVGEMLCYVASTLAQEKAIAC